MFDLEILGWGPYFAAQLTGDDQGCWPARVVADHGARLEVMTEGGAMALIRRRTDPPATVGDWVVLAGSVAGAEPRVRRLLTRRSTLLRRAAGTGSRPQVMAANVDVVFLVTAIGSDFNPRRLERMAVAVWESGARPVVLLNKTDLDAAAAALLETIAVSCPGVEVDAVSALDGSAAAAVRRALSPGTTGALLGSSGVGKSTIVNSLLAAGVQETAPVSARDGRGRHVTTCRRLFLLPAGGALIDGPGVRELRLWEGEEGLAAAFPDLARLAAGCRFRDCHHREEPGCAVREAVEAGSVPAERLASFHKLEREAAHEHRKRDALARIEETRRWKAILRSFRRHNPRGD